MTTLARAELALACLIKTDEEWVQPEERAKTFLFLIYFGFGIKVYHIVIFNIC